MKSYTGQERKCEICGGPATIPDLSTTVEGVKTTHYYCDADYPFGVVSTVTLPHPNVQCSDDTCWCQRKPLGPFVREEE